MARRASPIELSFDSMTDLITNLSGGLILIVLLVLGLTRESSPKPGKSLPVVFEQANQLRFEVQAVDQQMSNAEQQLDVWEQDAQALLDQAVAPRAIPDT